MAATDDHGGNRDDTDDVGARGPPRNPPSTWPRRTAPSHPARPMATWQPVQLDRVHPRGGSRRRLRSEGPGRRVRGDQYGVSVTEDTEYDSNETMLAQIDLGRQLRLRRGRAVRLHGFDHEGALVDLVKLNQDGHPELLANIAPAVHLRPAVRPRGQPVLRSLPMGHDRYRRTPTTPSTRTSEGVSWARRSSTRPPPMSTAPNAGFDLPPGRRAGNDGRRHSSIWGTR